MLRVQCTQCGKRVRAGDDWAGRTGNCPNCQAEIRFPDAAPLGWELPPGWEPQPTRTDRPKKESKYLPVVEKLVHVCTALFFGILGSWLPYDSVTAFWTGVLQRPRHRGPIIRAYDPIGFWLITTGKLVFGSLLLLFFVLFIIVLLKRSAAAVPCRFTLRKFLTAFTVTATALGLVIIGFKLAQETIHDPIYIVGFLFAGTYGLMTLGQTWIGQKKGYLEGNYRSPDDVLRDYHPWRFWFGVAIGYLFGGALLVLAVVLLVGAFLK